MPSARPVLTIAALGVALLAVAGAWAHFAEPAAAPAGARPHVLVGLAGGLAGVLAFSWLGLYGELAAGAARRIEARRRAAAGSRDWPAAWSVAAIGSAMLVWASGGAVATGAWTPGVHRAAALAAMGVQAAALVRLGSIHAALRRRLQGLPAA